MSLEQRLPKTKLTILCTYQPVLDYVKSSDHVLYQTLVETLIPEVLRPIPGRSYQILCNLSFEICPEPPREKGS